MQSDDITKKKTDLEAELEKKISEARTESIGREYKAIAQEHQLSFTDLKGTPVNIGALTLINEETARRGKLAVIYRLEDKILVAVSDPGDEETKKTLAELTAKGFSIRLILTTPQGLEIAWSKYKNAPAQEAFEVGSISIDAYELSQIQDEIKDISDLKNKITSISTTKLLEILLAGALKIEASDVHFEPEAKDNTRIRYRLDGYLQDVATIESKSYGKLVSRIKVLAKLTLNIHGAPQDGRFTIKQKDVEIEVRVSVLPSEYGETVVMRLLDPRTIRQKLEDLGMRDDVLELVKKQLGKANGTIMTTGPTGSGKTTSLYAFVNYLNTPDVKIITIEDPIEYHISGISQTQVEPEKGYTFAGGLRAIVRQDPDVILVGEIRDQETADIALQAALTGHIVLTTLHTNDAAGSIPRLIDLGVKAQTIAPAISLAMAQRLLRKLCDRCKTEAPISEKDLKTVQKYLEPIKERLKLPALDKSLKVYLPGKCQECNGIGYKGRVGVYEGFTISRDMEKLIMGNMSVTEIRDLAIKEGMITMSQDAYIKYINGITTIEEIGRILGED